MLIPQSVVGMEAAYINLPNALTRALWILPGSDVADGVLTYAEEYRVYTHRVYHLMLLEVRHVANLERVEWGAGGCAREGRALERERGESVGEERERGGD